MIINPSTIKHRMKEMGISTMRLCLMIHITPIHLNRILHDGACCEEIAHCLADVLFLNVEDIVKF